MAARAAEERKAAEMAAREAEERNKRYNAIWPVHWGLNPSISLHGGLGMWEHQDARSRSSFGHARLMSARS